MTPPAIPPSEPSMMPPFRRTVEPERVAQPASWRLVWGSLFIVWAAALLPWRQWPQAPDLLILTIAFWSVHEPRRVGMMTAFIFGVLMDVHDSNILGSTALSYVLTIYGALALHRRLQRFDLWRQAIHMLPIFLGARLAAMVVGAWIAGKWPGWNWAVSSVFTALMWPLASWVLLLFQRGTDDVQPTSV